MMDLVSLLMFRLFLYLMEVLRLGGFDLQRLDEDYLWY